MKKHYYCNKVAEVNKAWEGAGTSDLEMAPGPGLMACAMGYALQVLRIPGELTLSRLKQKWDP